MLGSNWNKEGGCENRLCEDLVMAWKWQKEPEKTKPHSWPHNTWGIKKKGTVSSKKGFSEQPVFGQ